MPTPALDLPASRGHTVKVSIINGGRSRMPANLLVEPAIKGHEMVHLPCYSFLVESSHTNQKVLFDLAFMKNLEERMPPARRSCPWPILQDRLRIKNIYPQLKPSSPAWTAASTPCTTSPTPSPRTTSPSPPSTQSSGPTRTSTTSATPPSSRPPPT